MDFQDKISEGIEVISANDPVLALVISRNPRPDIQPHSNYFQALASSIIGQQLSVKAASTIRQRFADLGHKGFPRPDEVLQMSDEVLRGVGLSNSKVKYIKDLAAHVQDGRLDLKRISNLTNDEIVVEVTDVKGIGEWTAHMFLIFCLGRLEVLPVGDLGVRNGIRILYGLRDLPDDLKIRQLAAKGKWEGYESIASWYIWKSLDTPQLDGIG
ncbi:MAG TPA: hypothetical protein VLF21_03470 [Candidatus Saccharimonadales bacterium]|nr:hypothetical protein [Candidatus Saccharimonadales bacterium]